MAAMTMNMNAIPMNMPMPMQAPYQVPYQTPYQIPYNDMKKDQEKEIKEALEVADEALKHLRAAKKYLNKSQNWGIIDILGDGCLSSMFKQGNMCDARRELIASRDAITKLNDELKDVENIDTLQTGNLLDFCDIFVDNIFVDVVVQSKINTAKKSCKKAIFDIENIKKDLLQRLEKLH